LPRYRVPGASVVLSLLRQDSDRREEPHGQGSRAAGGGAPGWRPRPFGLVGVGLGDGVGRRGDYLRGQKKKAELNSVPTSPWRLFCSIITVSLSEEFSIVFSYRHLISDDLYKKPTHPALYERSGGARSIRGMSVGP